MSSKLKIFNRACALFGQEPVSDVDEGSPRARALRSVYDDELESILAEGVWSFAKTSKTLTVDSSADTHPRYSYQYHLPGDLVRVYRLNGCDNETTHALFEIEGRHLVTDESSAKLEYVRLETNPGLFPVKFAVAFAHKLAIAVGPRFGMSGNKLQLLEAKTQDALDDALFVDAVQVSTIPFVTDDLNRARRV